MNLFLGRPIVWWIRVKYVLDLFEIKDSDQLAFMLRSRSGPPPKEFDELLRALPEQPKE